MSGRIDDLALIIETQANELFPGRTDQSMFLKMYGELAELIEAKTPEEAEREYADVMIMLLDYGSRKMFRIEHAIRNKMQINETREWKVNALGVFQHVDK